VRSIGGMRANSIVEQMERQHRRIPLGRWARRRLLATNV